MSNSQENEPVGTKKKSLLNLLVKFVLPLFLGVVIIYYLFKDINLAEMWLIVKDANWGILLFSLLLWPISNVIRGYRWELLIRPLGYAPKVSNLTFAILGSYAVNFAFPRAGEVWRCGIMSKEESIPFGKLLGTVILDRVIDMLSVLLIVLLACVFNLQFFITHLKNNQALIDKMGIILSSPYFHVGIFVFVLLVFLIFKFFGNNFIILKIKEIVRGIVKDMKAIWRMKTKFRFLFYSLLTWVCYFLYFYISFYAFDFTEDLGITAGLAAFALSSLSMGVPSNGGLGPWQAAIIASLTMFGISQLQATAFATGVFAAQSLCVIFSGLFGIVILSVNKRGVDKK